MSRMRCHVTRSFAALALAAIPAVALAQAAAAQPNPAADHLAAAHTALNKVLNAPVPAADMYKRVNDLKTEYLLLERAVSTSSPDWFAHYTMIDRLIGEMLGPSPASTEPGAVGTSGRVGSVIGRLEPGAAAGLQEFRTHLMAFSAAMTAVAPSVAAPAPPPPAAGEPTPSAAVPPAHAAATAAVDTDASGLVDQVTALVDGALGVGTPASDTVSVDRAVLERIRKQLEQIRQRLAKP